MTTNLQTIRTICVDSTRIDNIFNPPSKSRSTIFLRLTRIDFRHVESTEGERFVSIRWNRVHESISGLSNRKYQRRIDSSWVYWTVGTPPNRTKTLLSARQCCPCGINIGTIRWNPLKQQRTKTKKQRQRKDKIQRHCLENEARQKNGNENGNYYLLW